MRSNITWVSRNNDVYPEPHPDWPTAIPTWGWAWTTHVYGTGGLFSLLIVYDIVILLYLNKRLRSQPFILGIFIIVFFLCCVNVAYLLIDPYGSLGVYSVAVFEVLRGMTFPCLSTTLGALEIVILGMTKVNFGARRSRTQRVFCVYVIVHFMSTAMTYTWASIDHNLHLLIMLSQGIYVTFGSALCFIFTYNSYRVTQFTSETNRVMKQINLYTKVKKEAKTSGSKRELSLMRISKPRLRDAYPTEDCSEYDSGAESSDTFSLYQEALRELEHKGYRMSTVSDSRNSRDDDIIVPRHENQYTFNNSHLSLDLSSESDYVTEGPSPNTSAVSMDERYCSQRHDDENTNFITSPTLSEKFKNFFVNAKNRQPINRCRMSFTKMPSKRSRYINGHVNTGFDKDSHCGSELLIQDADGAVDATVANPEPLQNNDAIENQDGGYMADTEVTTPGDGRRKKRNKKSAKLDDDDDLDDQNDHSVPVSFQLPLYTGYLGLHRIRQGRVLRKVHKVTYLAVVFVFCTCVLQVYAMFGDLGVLSKNKTAEPWPWFVFNTLSRLCEFSAAAVMTIVAHRIGSKRYRSRRKRHNNNKVEIQTRC